MSDLISRADAIAAIRRCKFESVMPSDWYIGMECAQDIVKELPSANVIEFDFNKYQPRVRNKVNDGTPSADVVQGEWQKVEEQPYFRKHYDTVCCSVCRKKGNRKWNFCPNCGAKMNKGGAE